MMQLSTTLLIAVASSFGGTSAQTNVGCDNSCPPLGYESDSSHLCPGNVVNVNAASRLHDICHPTTNGSSNNKLSFNSFKQPGHVTVIANYYTGCEAGRRESGVYAGIAQRIHDETSGKVNFVTSLKGGGSCAQWASIYQSDAVSMGLNGGVRPSSQPLTVSDGSLDVRDYFFTPPYPHPSYIILDENLEVTYKSVGPCCGYVSYFDCTNDVALGLDGILTEKIYEIYNKQMADQSTGEVTTSATSATASNTVTESSTAPSVNQPTTTDTPCQTTTYSDWSACSKTCGDGGIQFRHRANVNQAVETRPCPTELASFLPPCAEQCIPEFGDSSSVEVTIIATDLDSPRDLAFHPTPGIHLGSYSEGRTFHSEGEELWIANGNNHSISIIASLGTEYQTSISRLDRGYYHYMNNITALAFNTVENAPRNADQDTFNYFAVCNDNLNDYVGSKEPNYFMGPTLYDTDTRKIGKKNTVTRAGEDCAGNLEEECYFLHADMLHESPACIGIAHDPEVETAYGAVYWAFDTTGDNSGDGGQLVKFDFSQPHGPGSMDHSIAQVRRYPEVKLYRDDSQEHIHAGMVVHPQKRILYISNPGKGTIVAVHIDSGRYSRTAREEYPIFSNRLPSFEYSIYECVDQDEVFASGLDSPSGLALSLDGKRLFVAERGGKILALEVDSGVVLQTIDLQSRGYKSIGGLTVSPETGDLYFVDMDSNQVVKVHSARVTDGGECTYQSRINTNFQSALDIAELQVALECGEDNFSLVRDYSCEVDGTIPNGTLFEQVHTDTGYASDNPDVQSMAGMDEAAALLANRTDCEYDSELNFDALLLGGYYCHVCLPRNQGSSCDAGGVCANVQWQGFTCDNEFFVDYDYEGEDEPTLVLSSLHFSKAYPKNSKIELSRGVTYRFTVRTGPGRPVSIGAAPMFSGNSVPVAESSVKSLSASAGVTNGPVILAVGDSTPECVYLTSPRTHPIVFSVGGANDCPSVRDLMPQVSAGFMVGGYLTTALVLASALLAFK